MSEYKKKIEHRIKKIFNVLNITSDIFPQNSPDSDLSTAEDGLINIIAALIKSDGVIREKEFALASSYLRNNAPVERANKLMSQLESKLKANQKIDVVNSAMQLAENLNDAEKLNIFQSLTHYSIDNGGASSVATLTEVGEGFGYSKKNIESMLSQAQKSHEQSSKYGKVGAIIAVVMVLLALLFLASFVRPVFMGLALAYLMDPLLSLFERKTRFKRSQLCIASIVIGIVFSALLFIKLFSSINFDEVKTFTVKAPTQVMNGLKKIKTYLEDKNAPDQIIEPIDQIIYGNIHFTTDTLFELDDEQHDHGQIIDNVLTRQFHDRPSLLEIFPEYKNIQERFGFLKKEAFTIMLNEILNSPEKSFNLIQNFKETIQDDNSFNSLDDIDQKILTRNTMTDIFSLTKFQTTSEKLTSHLTSLINYEDKRFQKLTGNLLQSLKITFGFLMDLILGIGFYFFFSIKFYQIGKGILEVVPSPYRHNTDLILKKINWVLEGFMRGQFLLVLIETILFSIVFTIIGIPYGFLLGCLSGVAVLVPYLGVTLAFGLTLISAIAGGIPIVNALIILGIVFVVINLVENFYLAPKLVGDRVGLSDLETLIALVIGGTFGGIVGVVIAIPTAGIFKIFIKLIYERYKESSFYNQQFLLIVSDENEPNQKTPEQKQSK